MTLAGLVAGIDGLYRKMARRISPPGTIVHCGRCGLSSPCAPEEAAKYLRVGWPVHCGATMELRVRRRRAR